MRTAEYWTGGYHYITDEDPRVMDSRTAEYWDMRITEYYT
jgi:hypothetical protein